MKSPLIVQNSLPLKLENQNSSDFPLRFLVLLPSIFQQSSIFPNNTSKDLCVVLVASMYYFNVTRNVSSYGMSCLTLDSTWWRQMNCSVMDHKSFSTFPHWVFLKWRWKIQFIWFSLKNFLFFASFPTIPRWGGCCQTLFIDHSFMSISPNSSMSVTIISPFQIHTAYNAQQRNIPDKTFTPNLCNPDWSFGEMVWYSTIASKRYHKSVTRHSEPSFTKSLPIKRSWMFRTCAKRSWQKSCSGSLGKCVWTSLIRTLSSDLGFMQFFPEALHSYFHFFPQLIFGVSVDIKCRILWWKWWIYWGRTRW